MVDKDPVAYRLIDMPVDDPSYVAKIEDIQIQAFQMLTNVHEDLKNQSLSDSEREKLNRIKSALSLYALATNEIQILNDHIAEKMKEMQDRHAQQCIRISELETRLATLGK